MAEDNKVNQLGWFLAGLGVGALVGILYAPKSGRETREKIASGAREGTEYLRVRSQQVAEKVGTLVDKGKEQAGEFVDRGRAQWEEFVERGKNLVNDQTTRVTAAVDAGREAYRTTVGPVDPDHV
ncbi:MAG: YtxH domain-containing protein [Terracidiphilus sp.]|jgi:gas vesicle protein